PNPQPGGFPYNVTLTLDSADFQLNFPNGPQERTDALTITVGPLNVGAAISTPGDQTVLTGAAASFAPPTSIADPDAGTNPVQATLTINLGTLTVTGNGGVNVFGNGTGTLKLIGDQASINTALATLVFQAPVPGQTTLTVTVDDLGNSGLGGAKTT